MPPSMCSACALNYQSSRSFRHTLRIGGNITAEVAEHEAGEVLFCRVGAEEVARQHWDDPRLAAQRAEFDADLLHPI